MSRLNSSIWRTNALTSHNVAAASLSVPGVYRRQSPRVAAFPRLRTDVVGFVGAAGPRHFWEPGPPARPPKAVRVDDWRSYEIEFLQNERGEVLDPPPGSRLAATVRDYFANGGARCWIVNAGTSIEPDAAQNLLNESLGLAGHDEPHGLELLLRQDEVSMVVLPELDARVETRLERGPADPAPGPPCFVRCSRIERDIPPAQRPLQREVLGRLYDDETVLEAQRYLLSRLQQQRWRWFAILAPPEMLDQDQVIRWRERLTKNLGDCDFAALYWPWLLAQETPGADVERRSPVGFVAGVFARKDLASGPHVAPANEPLRTVVGLERPVDDRVNGEVYDRGINVLRALPGRGINVWGARTLLWESPDSRTEKLAFVSARRCLSAVERMAERIGQDVVFEPHSPLLRVQVGQAITAYLLRVFESGALVGEAPEDAFFVRCDSSNNPPEQVDQGQLLCEVGLALAAPAEFIVFRVGRSEGVAEIEEID